MRPSDEPGNVKGDLLHIVGWAGVRWPSNWSSGLLIFERCLVYSGGHTLAWVIEGGTEGLVQKVTGHGEKPEIAAHQHYDARLALIAGLNLDQIVALNPANWYVWSKDVKRWRLRRGVAASRLRLKLSDGTRRKVLWAHWANSFPPVRDALERALPPR